MPRRFLKPSLETIDTDPDGLNLRILRSKPKWTIYGLCYRDNMLMDLMFADAAKKRLQAKMICRGCPVREQCLEYGLNEPYGIWGGLDEQERLRLANINEGEDVSVSLGSGH